MRRILIILLLGLGSTASGATYYVSSSVGNDSNNGTSVSTPWRTLNKVNTSTFQPGDSILFSRGDVWNDARNSARQDNEIEATKARVVRLEQIAATNTEGRIRTEVELGELREGQAEIKALIQAHDNASKKELAGSSGRTESREHDRE